VTASSQHFVLRIARARHDLNNCIGHIHGFSEMWLEDVQEDAPPELRNGLRTIYETAAGMIARATEALQAAALERSPGELPALQQQLCDSASRILVVLEEVGSVENEVLKADLGRIEAAALRARDLARNSLPALLSDDGEQTDFFRHPSSPFAALVSAPADIFPPVSPGHEGQVLVVDDLEENRELLSRRLSRIGYSVHTLSNGEAVFPFIERNSVDLILLDILMPGLDGFEVLRRLKDDPLKRHIPVVMLSSEDQTETVVRCIKLGADDFLPKPFNPTLLAARVESSLSKKRSRDKETALLHRIQAEQHVSERLLLNILPSAIAGRLKNGETVIADAFSNVTVLFADFVSFTRASAQISPKDLVTSLNDIFSKFDLLCEKHGVEKIKMIGDAYMAVAGLPAPLQNHAQAAAALALDMQREAAGLKLGKHACRMRIGLNSGPVVAGVIGSKKFAYDLWGDTVNLASRMENHAPAGGILVAAQTYELLKTHYSFKPGRMIRVKGKGQVLSYLMLAELRSVDNPIV
jgi:adenylate cyclase